MAFRVQVCFPLLDIVGQYYFWPYLFNRYALPLLVDDQRDLRLLQKGTLFVSMSAWAWNSDVHTRLRFNAL